MLHVTVVPQSLKGCSSDFFFFLFNHFNIDTILKNSITKITRTNSCMCVAKTVPYKVSCRFFAPYVYFFPLPISPDSYLTLATCAICKLSITRTLILQSPTQIKASSIGTIHLAQQKMTAQVMVLPNGLLNLAGFFNNTFMQPHITFRNMPFP